MSEKEELLREILAWTITQMQSGRSAESVLDELTSRGVPDNVASEVVRVAQRQNNVWASIPRKFVAFVGPWVAIILVYVAINGLLWAGQEVLARDDVRAVEEMEFTMDELEAEISSIELFGERNYVGPELEARYDALIGRFNAMVPEYNDRVDKAYSRWWLLPVPMPGSASRAARQ